MIESIVFWIVNSIGQLGYPGIFILMFLESSFFPFPSEVVMIPAGYLAAQGKINFYSCIALGTAGSLAGAYLNYFLAVFFGRNVIIKYGAYVGLSQERFERACSFFNRHGGITTFICRLLPGIRQIISFPAGLSRMNFALFSLYTAIGAGIWVTTLTLIGWWAGGNTALIKYYSSQVITWIIIGCLALIVIYIYLYKKNKGKKK